MKNTKKCQRLVQKIEEVFRKGSTLSSSALHYIDSTFAHPSIEELREIIADESNDEKGPLVDLMFFPDETVQTQLEDTLESEDFQKADADTVLELLHARPLETKIKFPDHQDFLKLEMPPSAAEQLVSRLKISKKLDTRLVETIGHTVAPEFRNLFKVKLRNARFMPTANQTGFICTFLERMNAEVPDLIECFDFVLDFLDEQKQDTDIIRALVEKKRFYFQNIQKAEKFEAQLQNSNMETLILQGVRAPYINKDDARRKMAIIDRINRAVFGRTEYVGLSCRSIDLGEYRKDQDVKKVIKMLS